MYFVGHSRQCPEALQRTEQRTTALHSTFPLHRTSGSDLRVAMLAHAFRAFHAAFTALEPSGAITHWNARWGALHFDAIVKGSLLAMKISCRCARRRRKPVDPRTHPTHRCLPQDKVTVSQRFRRSLGGKRDSFENAAGTESRAVTHERNACGRSNFGVFRCAVFPLWNQSRESPAKAKLCGYKDGRCQRCSCALQLSRRCTYRTSSASGCAPKVSSGDPLSFRKPLVSLDTCLLRNLSVSAYKCESVVWSNEVRHLFEGSRTWL